MNHCPVRKYLSLALSIILFVPQAVLAFDFGLDKSVPEMIAVPFQLGRESFPLSPAADLTFSETPSAFLNLPAAPQSRAFRNDAAKTQDLAVQGTVQNLNKNSLTVSPLDHQAGQKSPLIHQAKKIIGGAGSDQNNIARQISSIFDGSPANSQFIRRLRPEGDGASPEEVVAKAALNDAAQRGVELESWGLPNSVPIKGRYLRYAKLYRMSGHATDLGIAFHEALKPLMQDDPQLLVRLTQSQFERALFYAEQATHYSLNPNIPGLHAVHRLFKKNASAGHDYPEWRQALIAKAREILASTPFKKDRLAHFSPVPEENRPSVILNKALLDSLANFKAQNEALAQVKSEAEKQAVMDELIKAQNLSTALVSATGRTLGLRNGQVSMISVTHDQIPLIVAELRRRKVESTVIEALVRSFPLGESLWRMGILKLWERGITGKGVKVAVIDNGVDVSHPDLQGAVSKTENYTRDRGDHTKGDHATPMADIIHAIAPEAEILSYQVLSNADLPGVTLNEGEIIQATLKALDQAEKDGARIINMSMGIPMGYASDVIAQKVDELAQRGVILVISAGNEGLKLPIGSQVRDPGTSKYAITVGAVDYHNTQADFSSRGPVFNPADYSIEVKPDVHAFGVNIKAAAQLPEEFYGAEPAPYEHVSGTSPAAPHISGVVALMLDAAQKAGVAAGPSGAISAAAKSAVVETAKNVNGIKILLNASEAVHAFVKRLQGIA